MGISAERIIDRGGLKRLPIGIEDFETVVRDFVYVDKSLLIRDLIDANFNAVLFCRPRRFGKSLAMRMLRCFFEAGVDDDFRPIPDRTYLFDGLAISQAGSRYAAESGKHPVIFLSLAEAAAQTWGQTRSLLSACVAAEFSRHDYLLSSPILSEAEKAKFRRLASGEGQGSDLENSLSFLSDLLARFHGAGTVVLIDEYDAPVAQGHICGFRKEAIDFQRTWLTGALKATESLYLGVLTGVQRVSRESIFSGLNNIVVDTALDHEFTEGFGFTEAEAEELASMCGRRESLPEMRDWYDGYRFGSERVYNPWSVLSYLGKDGVAQPYWGNTSSNSIVHQLFDDADADTADNLALLAGGGAVRERIDLGTVFDELGTNSQAIWSQLYLAGYLTTDDTDEPNNARKRRELRVPNREVRLLFREEFSERSEALAGNRAELFNLHDALVAGNEMALEQALRKVLLDSPSAFDLVRENSYHMLLVGLLYYVDGYKFPVSNREAGDGRADVLLGPERENEGRLPGIVIEVKWDKDADDDELRALADKALEQVELRSYGEVFSQPPIMKWGIAFSGKRVNAVCQAMA